VRSRRIRRSHVERAEQRDRAVDHEPDQRQDRQQPHQLGDGAGEWMHSTRLGQGHLNHPLSRLMFLRSTVSWWRKIAMMMANPTAASAAATLMTKITNTCPPAPYSRENPMNDRFTALSMSSTHMKMMIAFRRVSTPITPITNSTAEKKRASGTMSNPGAWRGRPHQRSPRAAARS